MTQTCRQCSRVNPREAAYCYYDGTILGARDGEGGPLNVGTQPFHSPFVFPSGLICRNFEQLALACQENWSVVLELLQQGFLESFLSSHGRIDLALAAREAARFPDRDRGLDQFLGQLPGNILQAPRLHVEPSEINLGLLPVGEDRRFEIALENQGMRLLYGSMTCVDCVWLALGDTPGVQQKLFQFPSEWVVPVHVRGQYLRAGNKLQEGRVVIDSNGGKATVLVRLEVPVKPLAEGVLAGARSPRQVAEKAKAHPKEAAVLMESGALARWYQENGWQYPVQGLPASGLGAVQQFFEALGLVTPPKVQVSESVIPMHGKPGDKLEHVLKVSTAEKRPVYAHATSDQPWLEVGQARLSGRMAFIPITVRSVPQLPGETLHGCVRVIANGNQCFMVSVSLAIAGRSPAAHVFADWHSAMEANRPPVVLANPAMPVAAEPILDVILAEDDIPYAIPVVQEGGTVLGQRLPPENQGLPGPWGAWWTGPQVGVPTAGPMVHCPTCGLAIPLSAEIEGRWIDCPSCGQSFAALREETDNTQRTGEKQSDGFAITGSVRENVGMRGSSQLTIMLAVGSFVMGGLGVVLCRMPPAGSFFGLLGLVLGIASLAVSFQRHLAGIWLVLAGLAISALAFGLAVFML